jgi:uncharacterized membrane protein YfcA
MLIDLSQHLLFPLLFMTGLLAGTIDAIAGGGGLISLPMLLSIGVPPHIALGTNKLQSSIGTLVATWSYHRQGWFSFRTASTGLFFGAIGATLGSITGQIIEGAFLGKIIPLLLILILAYSLFAPKTWAQDSQPKLKEVYFYSIFGFVLSFYDGFFGPGTGSFWVFTLVFFLGYNFTKATAYTKILNLNSNLVALLCFALGHNIDYRIGFCMALGQLIGGRLGTHLALKKGAGFIRPIFIIVVCSTIITLVYKNFINTPYGVLKTVLCISFIIGLLAFYLLRERRNKLPSKQT